MVKLLFLGSGSAFTLGADNYQSNMLLTHGDRCLLIDCGSDIRFSLHAQGLSYRDLTDIFISHLHADHVGGLEYVGMSSCFDPSCDRPRLIISEEISADLWERTLSGGMRSVGNRLMKMSDYFDVETFRHENQFRWQRLTFQPRRLVHIDNGYFTMPSYGLGFEADGLKIFISTDTQLHWELVDSVFKWADLIFHDCETATFPTKVHAHYHELQKLPPAIRQKMWLYGYQPGVLPNATSDGFQGFVQRSQLFDFAEVANLRSVKLGIDAISPQLVS
ncbi:MAG: MBL fold metallo-hydrolase [Cyanobacteria bacterium P01_H01_bin.15]